MIIRSSFLVLLGLCSASMAAAERQHAFTFYEDYARNSVRPIPESHILTRRRVWRQIDLKEKQNKPMFANQNEITKCIIEGVRTGALTAYRDEECTKKLSKADFLRNLQMPGAHASPNDTAAAAMQTSGFEGSSWGSDVKNASYNAEDESFLPSQITTLRIVEDQIFDKVAAREVQDIQTVVMIIPADKFETGISRDVACFSYKELAGYLDKEKFEWVNEKNSAANMLLTEALDMRLFNSRIIMIENPEGKQLADIYNGSNQEALIEAQKLEQKLLAEDDARWAY